MRIKWDDEWKAKGEERKEGGCGVGRKHSRSSNIGIFTFPLSFVAAVLRDQDVVGRGLGGD